MFQAKISHKIRTYWINDRDFIFDSWIKAIKNKKFREVNGLLFTILFSENIERILERKSTNVYISCNPSREEQIYGYIISEGNIFHWAHVKKVSEHGNGFRRLGICTSLIDYAFYEISNIDFWIFPSNSVIDSVSNKINKKFNYNLYSIRGVR